MRYPGLHRWAILSQNEGAPMGYSLTPGINHGPGAILVVHPGQAVLLRSSEILLAQYDGGVLSLAEAVKARRAVLRPGYSMESQRPWFQSAVHNGVWRALIPTLALSRENPDAWKLDGDDRRLVLLGPDGEVRAEVQDVTWWRIIDPDREDEYARQLEERAGLEARWRAG